MSESITTVYEARLWIKDYLLKASKEREQFMESLLLDNLMYLPLSVRENAEKALSSRVLPRA